MGRPVVAVRCLSAGRGPTAAHQSWESGASVDVSDSRIGPALDALLRNDAEALQAVIDADGETAMDCPSGAIQSRDL